MQHYDLAIIGSGSGNTVARRELADWRIAIIEEGTFGGTCINVGCIPTKMYVYAADVAETVADAGRYGVDASLDGVRWRDVRDRIYGRVHPVSESGREHRVDGANTTLYKAHAEFVSPHQLRLSTGEDITADQIVIAAGSRPIVPPEVADAPHHTSSTIMTIDEVPDRLAILGGGYVAAEFAHVFSSFGSQVTIITHSHPLLPHLDREIAQRFTDLAAKRWDVRLDVTVSTVDGSRLTLSDGSTVDTDLLLVAAGRRPNSDRLNLEAAGVALHDDRRIVVDEYQRTTTDGVWALGDVCSPHQLKHVSNHEARVVSHNLAHPDDLVAADHRYVPAAVFTHPQLATVGLTEEQAREQGLDYVRGVKAFGDVAYGWAMEDTTGVAKVLADRTSGRLLGAHLMGPQSSSLIQPLVQAMSFGQAAHDVARGQYWIHPALAEVVENVLLKLR
ncbi:MAG TPA: mycothione reductase [Jatrophihabitantaceae bacterium]